MSGKEWTKPLARRTRGMTFRLLPGGLPIPSLNTGSTEQGGPGQVDHRVVPACAGLPFAGEMAGPAGTPRENGFILPAVGVGGKCPPESSGGECVSFPHGEEIPG